MDAKKRRKALRDQIKPGVAAAKGIEDEATRRLLNERMIRAIDDPLADAMSTVGVFGAISARSVRDELTQQG